MAEEARKAVDSVVEPRLVDRDWVDNRRNEVRARYYQLVRDVLLQFSIIVDLCDIVCEYAPMRKMMIVTPPPVVRPAYRLGVYGSALRTLPAAVSDDEMFEVIELWGESRTIYYGRSRHDQTKHWLLVCDAQSEDRRWCPTRIQLPDIGSSVKHDPRPQIVDGRFIAINTGETQICIDLRDMSVVFLRATEDIVSATDFDRRELVDYAAEFVYGNGIYRVVLSDGSETEPTPLCNLTVPVYLMEFYPELGAFRIQNYGGGKRREIWFKIEWCCGGSVINDIIRLSDWTLVTSSPIVHT